MNKDILLDQLMNDVENKQMHRDEYKYISNFLGDINFLVFGTGYDSNYWRLCNNRGKTIFLENLDWWISEEFNDIVKVNYSTILTDHSKLLNEYRDGNFENLKMDLPTSIIETKWDVIFVDSPTGYDDYCPGRMQSIFTAKQLSNTSTDIFVHDCDRIVENTYTQEMFNVVNQLVKLRHLKKK